MRVKLMTLRFSERLGAFDAEALEEFCKDKHIDSVREHFFQVDGVPHVALLVCYRAASRAEVVTKAVRDSGADHGYKQLLQDDDWPLFQTLRVWRGEVARRKGVPPYVVFTNAQLALIARSRPDSKTALGHIEGIGKAKIEEYGEDLLRIVGKGREEAPAAAAPTGAAEPPGGEGAEP
ncbi:MAG: HRDC domain-containing protein [Planctomycetota bacterium]